MNLLQAVRRAPGDPGFMKIPWDDPQFSARMLREHLSQAHDAASRRFDRIERHVAWIHEALLGGKPSRVLDLGCGPGFYTQRLAQRGHICTGVDFGPAAIDHARSQATKARLAIEYRQEDLRLAEFGRGFDLAMLIYGELNAFTPAEAAHILGKVRAALTAGGQLLLEVSTEAGVRRMGAAPRTWYTTESGLYADSPYLCLKEAVWDDALARATQRFYVMDQAGSGVQVYGSTTQAYTDDDYTKLLEGRGFSHVAFEATFAGELSTDFVVITAQA